MKQYIPYILIFLFLVACYSRKQVAIQVPDCQKYIVELDAFECKNLESAVTNDPFWADTIYLCPKFNPNNSHEIVYMLYFTQKKMGQMWQQNICTGEKLMLKDSILQIYQEDELNIDWNKNGDILYNNQYLYNVAKHINNIIPIETKEYFLCKRPIWNTDNEDIITQIYFPKRKKGNLFLIKIDSKSGQIKDTMPFFSNHYFSTEQNIVYSSAVGFTFSNSHKVILYPYKEINLQSMYAINHTDSMIWNALNASAAGIYITDLKTGIHKRIKDNKACCYYLYPNVSYEKKIIAVRITATHIPGKGILQTPQIVIMNLNGTDEKRICLP